MSYPKKQAPVQPSAPADQDNATEVRPEYFSHKRIFAALFCGFVLLYSLVQIGYSGAAAFQKHGWTGLLQSSYGSNVFGYAAWQESNGLLHRLLQKNEFNNFTFVKDRMGYLHYALLYYEHDGDQPIRYAKRIKWMRDLYQRQNTKVYYVNIPSRYQPAESRRYIPGIPYQDTHVLQDDLYLTLEQFHVPIIDIQKALQTEGLPYESWFYRTDLHWCTESALFAAERMADALRADGLPLPALPPYSFESQRSSMLGTEGIITGRTYAGLDDFVQILPKDDYRYHWSAQKRDGTAYEASGTAQEVFLQPIQPEEPGKPSAYINQYASYLGGSMAWQQIQNQSLPEAPRILLIGDTFCSPLLAYLAPVCSQVAQINPLAGDQDIEEHLQTHRYDAILVLFYPGNLTDAAFPFFEEKPASLPRARQQEAAS